jgi:hypothetical protein
LASGGELTNTPYYMFLFPTWRQML